MELHSVEVQDSTVLSQGCEPQQAGQVGFVYCWDGQLPKACLVGGSCSECDWQVAVVMTLLGAISDATDPERALPLFI